MVKDASVENNTKNKNSKPKKFMKKFGIKQVGLILIIFLISISLIPWVINNNIINNADSNKWVMVGDKSVVSNIILGEYRAFIEQNYYYIQQNPYTLMQFLNDLITRHVNTLLFASEAERINISVDDNLLLQLISEIPVFQNPDGTFNAEEFKKRVTMIFGSEKNFLDSAKNTILKDQIFITLSNNITQPHYTAYLDLMALYQEREIKYIEVDKSLLKTKIQAPTEQDLEALREENKTIFTTLESKDGEYILVNINDLLGKIKVTESEAKDFYEKNKSSYIQDELRDIKQTTFATKEEADKALKDNPDSIKLSPLEKVDFASLPENFAKQIFSAKLNELSGPIESPLGWYVFQVTKIHSKGSKTYEEVKEEVSSEVLTNKKNMVLEEKRNEILNLLNQQLPLSEVAKKTGAKYFAFSKVSDMDVKKGISETIYKQISTMTEKSTSGVLDDDTGNLFALRITKVNQAVLQDIQVIKADLVKLWDDKKIKESLSNLSAKIVQELVAGKKINELSIPVKSFKGTVINEKSPFTATSIELLWESDINKPLEITMNNGNQAVAIVSKITNKSIFYEKNGIKNQELLNFVNYTTTSYTNQHLSTYSEIISKKHDIKVNQEAIIKTLAPSQENANQ